MIRAKIIFLTHRTFYNHYRPAVKIRDDEMYNSCELIFLNKEKVQANEEIEVYMQFLRPELVTDYLSQGRQFTLNEGTTMVGKGEILSIIP
jgi:translation elongation factor EF-Tu-like GTPase